jgi:penicillin-insensitive murein endopeptidase
MRRTRILCLIGTLLTIPYVALAAPQSADPAIKAPAPIEVKREVAPAPPAAPAPAALPTPAPEQKAAAPEAKDKKGADKKAAGKKEKEKKPKVLAKELFSKAQSASALAPRAIGWYAKGCLAGGVHLADTGPDWQTMRLSRNRAWGHPKLVKLVKRLASESKQDGWSGLLVGDISQPRGGPMITGHASHQVGLDADIWLTPMPDRVLTRQEREDIQATSMLDKTSLSVDPKIFTEKQVALIKRAASYPQVERIFVNPAIKKALCQAAGKDRAWLGKVRPLWGHNYHFHIRIACPNGGCQAQPAVSGDDGCGKELTDWLKNIEASLKPKVAPKPGERIVPDSERRQITMDQLPADCRAVLNSPDATAVADDAPKATPTASVKK